MTADVICPNCHSITPPWRYCKVCNAYMGDLARKKPDQHSESTGASPRAEAETGCEFKSPMDARLHKFFEQNRHHNILKLPTSSTDENEMAVIAKVSDLEAFKSVVGEARVKAEIKRPKVAAENADVAG